MSEESKGSAGQGLGIAGLVLGIVALVISFIPCLGMYAVFPGILAIILSIIGLITASKNQGAKGLNIAALVISILGTSIASYQYYIITTATETLSGGMSSALQAATKEYDSCEDIASDLDITLLDINEKYGDQEQIDPSEALSLASDMMTIAAKIGALQVKAEELGCNQDVDYIEKMEELNKKLANLQGN